MLGIFFWLFLSCICSSDKITQKATEKSFKRVNEINEKSHQIASANIHCAVLLAYKSALINRGGDIYINQRVEQNSFISLSPVFL